MTNAKLTSRKLTIEGGPEDDTRAMWLRPFLQSLTRLEDLSVELLGISRRLTLPPDCIPSSTQHVYWDAPSSHQLGTLLSYRSITSLAIGIDVDMPLMTHSGAIHPSSITDLSLVGAHRPPPILTDRPLRLPAVVRYYFRICSAEPDDIVSGRPRTYGTRTDGSRSLGSEPFAYSQARSCSTSTTPGRRPNDRAFCKKLLFGYGGMDRLRIYWRARLCGCG